MDYVLITNPISKNIIIKFCFGYFKMLYSGATYYQRFYTAIMCCILHFIFIILYIIIKCDFIINLLVNIYPFIINLYIGYRCYNIIQIKKK
jgi:hypothetical protein